jgi:signal peptidase I
MQAEGDDGSVTAQLLRKASSIRQMLEHRGYIEIPSRGTSMFPLIRQGSICRFVPFSPEHAAIGDILLFEDEQSGLIGHRLLRKERIGAEEVYLCKGDSNRYPDAPVPKERVLGKLVQIRKGSSSRAADSYALRIWGKLMVRYRLVSYLMHRIAVRN